ncbi:MAG: hypothetical protein QW076_00545 [Candidatus Anstonellales archaeon]
MYYSDLFCKVVGSSLDASAFISSVFPNWFILSFVGILFSFFLMLVIYFIGKLLDMPNIEGYLRLELFEVLFTIIVLISIAGAVQFLCKFPVEVFFDQNVLNRIFGTTVNPTEISMFNIVEKYFEEVRIMHSYGLLMLGSLQLVLGISDITWQSYAGGIGIVINPMAGYGQQAQAFNSFISVLVNLYLVHMVLFRVLVYSAYAMFNYLLPMGIFFRCFQPTRKFGGALIGLVFGFNFVYPFLITLNAKLVFESVYHQVYYLFIRMFIITIIILIVLYVFGFSKIVLVFGTLTFMLVLLLSAAPFIGDFFQLLSTKMIEYAISYQQWTADMIYDPNAQSSQDLNTFLQRLLDVGAFVVGAPGLTFNYAIMTIGLFLMVDVVFQTINFLIVVSSVRAMTKLLGEEMDISLLTRMV